MNVLFSTELRGRKVQIQAQMAGAEPDVGIMSAYTEGIEITDEETGEALDWDLTDEELMKIDQMAADRMYDDFSDLGEYS